MASYKVAQDVEAEDKLLGPFTFRQFIYLVIAAMAGIVAYGLSRLFVPLFVIPLPIIIFFVILALPLRKDQPMEVYLAAIVSFYLKPRKRLWKPDGVQSLIEITVPTTQEVQRTKNLSESEAERRLAYLATLADTQGWSIRNATMPNEHSAMVTDVYNEAKAVQDVFDDSGDIARNFEEKIAKADAARREAMIARMKNPNPGPYPPQVAAPPAQAALEAAQPPQTSTPQVTAPAEPEVENVVFNPYPTSMRQHIISPNVTANKPPAAPQSPIATQSPPAEPASQSQTTPPSTSDNTVSPDIINLANNTDLSIDTIAREAHRIEQKKSRHDPEEVVISLR